MKQLNFNNLPIIEKALLLTEFGTYLESIEGSNHWIHLYSMNHHFFEVHYDLTTRQIDRISLIKYEDVDIYLSGIILINIKVKKL